MPDRTKRTGTPTSRHSGTDVISPPTSTLRSSTRLERTSACPSASASSSSKRESEHLFFHSLDRRRLFCTLRGRNVTSIGVLYDFTDNAENTTVQFVDDMVKEQWVCIPLIFDSRQLSMLGNSSRTPSPTNRTSSSSSDICRCLETTVSLTM